MRRLPEAEPDQGADPERIAVRRLAASVIGQALKDAQAGDVEARQWLRGDDPGPGRFRWWLARAGLKPEGIGRLLAEATKPRSRRKGRTAEGARSRVAMRRKATG